jgi:ParB family chromosome partitioning protein
MTPTTDAKTVPLTKLVPSPANMRRLNSEAGLDALAASIRAHGLIQNLTVRPAKGGKFEVVAGARRLAALRALAKAGDLAKDFAVAVRILDSDSDAEVSLAENTIRVGMHPADEIAAFKRLTDDEGLAPEDIAARFGISQMTVRRRLKLANLAPEILDLMRADEISLEQAQALAVSEDYAAQVRVWTEAQGYWMREPARLRAALTQEAVSMRDRLAQLVGLEAYEAAGGAMTRDLFSDDAETFLTDRPLLNRLAEERLAVAAAEIEGEGWKWVTVTIDAPSFYTGDFNRIYPEMRPATEEEAAELAALSAESEGIEARLDGYAEGAPEIAADEARLGEIEARTSEIDDAREAYDPAQMALAGCFVTVGQGGAIRIERGVVLSEDKAAFNRLRRNCDGVEGVDAGDGEAADATEGAAYSAKLIEDLSAIRTAALRVEIAERPEIALAALLQSLLPRLFYEHAGYWQAPRGSDVRGEFRALDPLVKEPDQSRPLGRWHAILEGWGDRLPGDPGELWSWLLEQPLDELVSLVAVVSAANVDAVVMSGGRSREGDMLARAVGLDMCEWWSPEALFLGRISKATITEVMREVGCATDAVKAAEKAPKADAVVIAEKALDGRGWLPSPLVTVPEAPTEEDADEAEHENLAEAAE